MRNDPVSGRYFNQAQTQLDGSPWTLMRLGRTSHKLLPATSGEPGVATLPAYCAALGRVGMDASLATLGFAAEMLKADSNLAPLWATQGVDQRELRPFSN